MSVILVQTDLKHFLPQPSPPECWDYGGVLPHASLIANDQIVHKSDLPAFPEASCSYSLLQSSTELAVDKKWTNDCGYVPKVLLITHRSQTSDLRFFLNCWFFVPPPCVCYRVWVLYSNTKSCHHVCRASILLNDSSSISCV